MCEIRTIGGGLIQIRLHRVICLKFDNYFDLLIQSMCHEETES